MIVAMKTKTCFNNLKCENVIRENQIWGNSFLKIIFDGKRLISHVYHMAKIYYESCICLNADLHEKSDN